jgi:hypothetical protein
MDPSRADSLWEDVGDDQACKRAGRTLGEKSINKAVLKQEQLESSCGDEDKKPSLAISADEAASSVPSSKTARRSKRPKASMDYIAAFRSQQLADDTVSPPATKKKRSLTFAAVDGKFVVDSLIHKKNESTLSPPRKVPLTRNLIDMAAVGESSLPKRKHMSSCEEGFLSQVVPLDICMILDDEQREQAHSLRESLPTAEFLTRCLDF